MITITDCLIGLGEPVLIVNDRLAGCDEAALDRIDRQ
jgi:hypothetical protein